MTKLGLSIALALSILQIGSNAWSAAWTIPSEVKIVQRSGGGTNTYDTIAAALASITNNSATNRYLIKVMPGTYVQTAPLQMKPYVDIEGSGQESTAVTASNIPSDFTWGPIPPTKATLVMAANARVSNILVENTTPANGIAILILSPSARVENVTARASGPGVDTGSGNEGGYIGVYVASANATDIVLENVTATGAWQGTCIGGDAFGMGIGVGANAGDVSIVRSKAVGSGCHYSFGSYSDGNIQGALIRDSVAEGTITSTSMPDSAAHGILANGSTILNSTVFAHDASRCVGIEGSGNQIMQSVVRAVNCPDRVGVGGQTSSRVAASLVEGGLSWVDRAINCWDENFNPIVWP